MSDPKAHDDHAVPRFIWIPALVFTSILLVFVLGTFFAVPNMSLEQKNTIHWIFSLLAAFATLFLGGTCLLRIGFPKKRPVQLALSATGGVAVLIFTYVYPPYWDKIIETDSEVRIDALRVLDNGPGLPILDVTLRNKGGMDASIHDAELLIDEASSVPKQGYPIALPVSYQYTATVSPGDERVAIPLSQVVPARGVDRFQIILTMGREDSTDEGPFGPALIQTYYEPDIEALDIKSARLRLRFNEGGIETSAPFHLRLRAPTFGFRASRQAGPSLDDKIRLLGDSDVNVVESVVRVLAALGGPKSIDAMRSLSERDMAYLERYYDTHIYSVYDAQYYDLPAPDERIAKFRARLASAIDFATDTAHSP